MCGRIPGKATSWPCGAAQRAIGPPSEGHKLRYTRIIKQGGSLSCPLFCARSFVSSRSRNKSGRSEEHTSELQSRLHLVCRLLLEKKKKKQKKQECVVL